jgi:hypothetical protein
MKHLLTPKNLEQTRPEVFKAFLKACGNQRIAKSALKWGNAPEVVIYQGMIKTLGGGEACGAYRGNLSPDHVEVSDIRVTPLERCTDVDLDDNKIRFEGFRRPAMHCPGDAPNY